MTGVTDIKVDISGASVQLADAVSAKLDAVVSVVSDVSGSSVSVQQVADVVSAKIETVVSVPAPVPAEEVIQVVSSNVLDVSGNLTLTPEQANVKGLFLDWAKKEPSL